MIENAKIVLLGDSITEGFNTGLYLPGYKISNRGMYGENSRGLLAEITRIMHEENPDIAWVLIGTNDFASGFSEFEMIANITGIIRAMKGFLSAEHIFLTSILPTRDIENRPNESIERINARLQAICASELVQYYDLHTVFMHTDGGLHPDFTTDGLHLSDKGYKAWSSSLEQLLEKLKTGNGIIGDV